jgi:menaquinone-dependent protoporphyrinogen oxidase
MKVLVVYGTTEGQTEKIASFVASRLILQGHHVLTTNAALGARAADAADFEAVLIAASLHAGRYQPEVVQYVKQHLKVISTRRNAFMSVSLAAAGHDPEDLAGLRQCVAGFLHETGWTPDQVHHVAGAFRYTQYDFLKRWAMKYIAYRKGAPTDTSRDYELTDWEDVGRFADAFVTSGPQLSPSPSAPGEPATRRPSSP